MAARAVQHELGAAQLLALHPLDDLQHLGDRRKLAAVLVARLEAVLLTEPGDPF